MTLVQLSDPHIRATSGGDPSGDLRAAVASALTLQPAPAAVLVSGDLVDDGSAAGYAEVREHLAAFDVPVHVMPGNHDDRAALRVAFPLADGAEPAAPYRYAADVGDLRLIACDTVVPGAIGGAQDADAVAWLSDRLDEDATTPTLVALHHPPMLIGMPVFDAIGLPSTDRAALAALLARHPQVRRVACGHVHLAASGLIGATPVLAAPSTWRWQFHLDLGAEELRAFDGPAGLVVHTLAGGELVSHVRLVDAV